MDRSFYLDLARSGVRFPIGTDLILHEQANAEALTEDGTLLGQVIATAARRWKSPLAIPLMDLKVEKDFLLAQLAVPAAERATYHFHGLPSAADQARIRDQVPTAKIAGRLKSNVDAVAYIAKHTDLLPVGMVIGPFSLTSKLFSDPITAVYQAGAGATAEDDDEVAAIEWALDAAMLVIQRSVQAQIEAGAKLVIMAEPAANKVYFSPTQVERSTAIYRRYSMDLVRKVKAQLDAAGVDFFFHDCGELCPAMLREIASLEPVILSLGSSRKLWEDEPAISPRTVMYGNMPTKMFSQDVPTVEQIVAQARDLTARMKATGHPFILGSECDVLSVPGVQASLMQKVQAFLAV